MSSNGSTDPTEDEKCNCDKTVNGEPPSYFQDGKYNQEDEGKLSEEDFLCSCCYEILINPTTLTCGHSFCRFCLAQWWYSSKSTVCPECRQQWHGFPKVNFTLRNTVERLFPSQVNEKKRTQSATANYQKIIKSFEDFGKSRKDKRSNLAIHRDFNCGHFCILVSIGIAVIVLVWLGFKTIFGGFHYELSTKPVSEWTVDEVKIWIGEQGSWAKGTYDKKFQEAGIDGTLLLKMTDQDLRNPPINMLVGVQRRVLMREIEQLKERKLKIPSDFWEYKAAHKSMSMFLLFGLREFPRATVTYLYFFNYHDIYLPFVHRTCPGPDHLDDVIYLGKKPTWSQWSQFSIKLLILPYYLFGVFAYEYLQVNWWTSRIVILQAVLLTACEMTHAKWFLTAGYRRLPRSAIKYFLFAIANGLFHKLVWPFIPFFICDCIFYWMLYVSPFDALNRFWKRLNTLRAVPGDRQEEERERRPRWHFDIRWNA